MKNIKYYIAVVIIAVFVALLYSASLYREGMDRGTVFTFIGLMAGTIVIGSVAVVLFAGKISKKFDDENDHKKVYEEYNGEE